jgi:uroporphyrin-III C-methyltransferase/precorrin-2 dehydrogenase/sirohydrochlorin ferrochelatase
MQYFPIFLDLDGRTVLVLGGGAPAATKLRLLAKTNARLRCVALNFHPEISALAAEGRVEAEHADPTTAAFAGAALVIAATGSSADTAIAVRARQEGILINAVDKPELCDFIMPAITDRGRVVVAIGTEGDSPVLARRIREQIEALLPEGLGTLAGFIGENRKRVADVLPDFGERRAFWEEVIDGPIGALSLSGKDSEAQEAVDAALNARKLAGPDAAPARVTVIVSPKAPDDLTLRALRALQDADALLYAPDVPAVILDRARRDAQRVGLPAGADPELISETVMARAAGARRIICLLGPAADTETASQLGERLLAHGYEIALCALVSPIA